MPWSSFSVRHFTFTLNLVLILTCAVDGVKSPAGVVVDIIAAIDAAVAVLVKIDVNLGLVGGLLEQILGLVVGILGVRYHCSSCIWLPPG